MKHRPPPSLPTTPAGIMAMTVRDFLVASVVAGKTINMFGFDIPAIPYVGRTVEDGDQDLFCVAVAVGSDAAWLKDQLAARVALVMAAGGGGTLGGYEPGNPHGKAATDG